MQTGPLTLPSVNTGGDVGNGRFPAGAYRANLYVYDPFGRIDWYALVPQSFAEGRYFTIGRGADCDITVDDGAVSSRHAFISAEEGELVLRDLRSTNGTTVNGDPLTEHGLRHGDVIRLGATDIRFLFSYIRSPVQLVLDFIDGPNGGKSVATYGASTHIGRFNCAINLSGPAVSPQHVRVDAFGEELIYVVNLHPDNETWLNERRVEGIAPARQGDVLRVGDHRLSLRVVEGDFIEVPPGEGTLEVEDRTPGTGAAPVMQVSASQIQKLEAQIRSQPRDASLPTPVIAPATTLVPPGRPKTSRPEAEAAALAELAAQRPAPKRRGVGGLVAVLCLLLVVGGAVAAWFIELPRLTTLEGRVVGSDASTAPVIAAAEGRLASVAVQAGMTVQPDTEVAVLADPQVEARLVELESRIKELESKPKIEKQVAVAVPAELARSLRVAEQERDDALVAAANARRAFERRELTLEQVEAAEARAEAARRRVYAVQAQVDEARGRRVAVKEGGPSEADYQEIARLVAERETLSLRRRVPLKAGRTGVVAHLADGIAAGADVRVGQPLFFVQTGEASRRLRVWVPEASVQAVESAGTGTLRAAGLKPMPVKLAAAAVRAEADGRFPMELPMPADVGEVLDLEAKFTIDVALPPERALLWAWGRVQGWFE